MPVEINDPASVLVATNGKHKERVRSLAYELDQVIKMLAWARECLENELMKGLGAKQHGITDKDLAKIKTLTMSLETAVNAKVRFDKASKAMVDDMTTEEQFLAAVEYVKSMDTNDQSRFLALVRDSRR